MLWQEFAQKWSERSKITTVPEGGTVGRGEPHSYPCFIRGACISEDPRLRYRFITINEEYGTVNGCGTL